MPVLQMVCYIVILLKCCGSLAKNFNYLADAGKIHAMLEADAQSDWRMTYLSGRKDLLIKD